MKTVLRIVGIVILAIIFYINGDHPIEYIFTFTALMSLVFWGIPAVVCWIFGLNKPDGIIYIDTVNEDSIGMKLHVYDPKTVLDKDELIIKVDIPESMRNGGDEDEKA